MLNQERYHYLVKLIKKVTKVSFAAYKYQSTPRTYGTEELLFMREAHFIDVVGNGEMAMGEIAEKLDVTNGAASQIAARLEKKGYICRKKDKTDSRHISCVLTEKAEKTLEFHRHKDQDAYEQFGERMAEFSQKELEVCNRFLDIVYEYYNAASLEETKKQCTLHKK